MKRNIKVYNNCAACPFKSRTCGHAGSFDAKIAIVGESPGTREIQSGQPFIGPSGELLERLLKQNDLTMDDVFITNAISCIPPRSKDDDGKSVKAGIMNDAAKACRHRLFAELTKLPNLETVISLGSTALRTLSESWSASILKKRGQLFDHTLVPADYLESGKQMRGAGFPLAPNGVMPMLHPAYILRNQAAYPLIKSDFKRIIEIHNGKKFPQPKYNYTVLNTTQEIDAFIRKGTNFKGPLNLIADIETTGLSRQHDKFMCIGFQFAHDITPNENNVYVVTGKDQGHLVRYLFRKMPENVSWVWHNGKFDVSFLRAKGLPRNQVRVDHDTLLLSYTLDEGGQRHSLEQCIMNHLGLPNYKDMLAEYVGTGKKKKSYAEVPKPILYDYLARDVVHTGLLFQKLEPQVMRSNRAPHLRKAYRDLLIPAANTLATIENNGMPINQKILEKSIEELTSAIEPLVDKMRKLVRDPDFNPNSHEKLLRLLKHRGHKITSTKKEILKKIKGDPLIDLLLEYSRLKKLLSTYLKSFRDYGGRVHTSYLLHGTVTGRLSSTDPNLQNIPKDAIVRRHFSPGKGRVLVSFDYSQAELRSLAVLSGDKELINIFKSGKDMHAAVAAQIYGKEFTDQAEFILNPTTGKFDLENPIYNKLRRNAKTVNFGIVYGATEHTLVERLGITWDEAHKLIVGWFHMFGDARKFMRECRAAPVEGRPITTIFGRERRFYVITDQNRNGQENEAGNFPHQSMCSDFTLAAAVKIDRIFHAEGLPGNAKQINIIHDDNMFECDDNDKEIRKLANLVRPIMEGVPVSQGITLLPFKADAKKGYSWDAMMKIPGL